MRSAAFAVYRLAAVPAEHFSFQQENSVATYLSYAIEVDPLPNLLEGFRRDDGRVCVSVNFTVYFVNADIFLVVQNIIDRVRKKTLTVVGYTALFQKGYAYDGYLAVGLDRIRTRKKSKRILFYAERRKSVRHCGSYYDG